MAGPSAAELKFLLSMNDQASGVLKNWISGLEKAGKGASDTESKNKTLGQSFDHLVAQAKQASVAIAGVWASNKMAKTSIAAFSDYEKGMYGISLTTGQAIGQMGDFESRFNELSKELNNVPVEQLEHFAETAGRLGLRGKDIDTFVSSAAKLQQVLHVSDDGVTAIGRMLFATGELETKGVKSVTDFSNALAAVQPNTKASAEELVQFASSLGTNTAQFHIASEALLGIGAAAAQSNLPLQLTGTTVGKAFTQIKDAALSGSQGMQQITQATGVTQEQFQDLLNSKPEEAFIVLLEAINKLNKEGSATNLLGSLQLQGAEYTRIFTTLGTNIDTIREKIKQGQEGAQGGGFLDRMFGDFSKTTSAKTAGVSRAFEGVVRDIGKALAPVYNAIVTPITAAFDAIDTAFRAFDQATNGWGPTIVTSLAVIGPGVAGALAALKLLGPAALAVLRAFSGWNTLKEVFEVFGGLPGILGGVSSALGVLRVALVALAGPWGIIAAAAVAAAVLIYENWEKLKDLLPDWLKNSVEYVGQKLGALWEYIKDTVKGWFSSEKDNPVIKPEVDPKKLDEAKKKIDDKLASDKDRKFTLNDDQLNSLKSLSPSIEANVNIQNQKNAIEQARKMFAQTGQSSVTVGAFTVTEEDVRRAEKIFEYQKQLSQNPLFEQTQGLNDQIAEAQAITADAKNELAIRNAIRDTVNKTGEDEAKVTREVGERMRLLQQSQQQSALIDVARGIQDQTRSLNAVTAQEKSRADIVKQINDFEREHGKLLDDDKQKLVAILATYNQQAEAVRLLNSLDPRAEADRRYASEIRTLQALRDQKKITEEMYRVSVTRLNMKADENDPTTQHIQQLRDELRISSLVGDEQKEQSIALEERNALQSQGVVITKQLNDQIERYAKAKVAADHANNEGLQGWAKQQGTMQENLNKLQENFADGLADAVTGALSGERGGFRQMLSNLGRQMLSMGIRQMMAQSILGMGNPAGTAATSQANSALNQIEALSRSGINSPQATINATTAIVNGQVQGGTVNGYAPTNSQVNQGAQQPTFSPLKSAPIQSVPTVPAATSSTSVPTISQAPVPGISNIPGVSVVQGVQSAQSAAPSALTALSPTQLQEAATKVASTALPNFASSPAFSAAAAAATKTVTAGPALKDITGATLKAVPPEELKSAASAGTQALNAPQQIQPLSATSADAFNIEKFSGLKKIGGLEANPENFVVHHTGPGISSPGQLTNVLNQRGLGVQYTVDKDGKVFQLTPQPNNREAHTLPSDMFAGKGAPKGISNDNSIGVEVMAANDKAVTEAQKVATANLYKELHKQFPNLNNVYGHGEINPGHKEATEGKTIADYIRQQKEEGSKAASAMQPQQVQLDKASLDQLTKGPLPANRFDKSIPASIRNNNPGALNYAPWEQQYGARGGTLLHDMTGQGNKISAFPTPEAGAAAQFDWWQNKSKGTTLGDNLGTYSGGNSTAAYQNFLTKHGFSPDTNVQKMLADKDQAIAFGKAQSHWEGGKPFPMDDKQWENAYQLYRSKNGEVMPSQSGATAENPWGNFQNGFANENSLYPKQGFGSTPSPGATDMQGFGSMPSMAPASNTKFLTSFGPSAGSSAGAVGSFGSVPTGGFTAGAASSVPGIGMGAANPRMFQGLNASLQQTSQAAQQAAAGVGQLSSSTAQVGQATQTAQTSMQGMDQVTTQMGQQVQSVTPQISQLGTQFQQTTPQISALGSSTGSVTSGFGGLDGSLSGLMGPLSSATSGLGSFGSSISSFVQQLSSSAGGMGGGGFGGGGGFFGLLGGLFADGGEIKGPGTGTSDSILAGVSNGEFIVNAKSTKKNLPLLHMINNDKMPGNLPKFAKGGHVGGPRSLGIGERALARGSAQPSAQIAALSNQVATLSKVVSNGGNRGQRVSNISQNITVNANDAGSFRRSEGQMTSDAFLKMNRAARRNG